MHNKDIEDLIPKHKHDHDAVSVLKDLSFEQIKPIVPALLEWLQDANWPIAGPIANVLEPFVDRIIPEIIKIQKKMMGLGNCGC